MSVLMSCTIELLKQDSRSLSEISIESKIPYHWLKSFKYGVIADPSVNRVEKLYVFLSGKPLRIIDNVLA